MEGDERCCVVCGFVSELNQHQQALQPRNMNPGEIISFFTQKALQPNEKLYIPLGDSAVHKNARALRKFVVTLYTLTKNIPSPPPLLPLPHSEWHVLSIKRYSVSGTALRDLQALSHLILPTVLLGR